MGEKKVQVADKLVEQLQHYMSDVEDGNHDPYYDSYLVDALCDMQETIAGDGVEDGQNYHNVMLVTDKVIKVYEDVEVERMLSGEKDKVKVMAILNVRPIKEGKIMVNFLGKKVRV